jgi:hypothetical protein
MLRMNKKGQFDVARKTIFWMMISVVIIMVVFGFAIIYSSYKDKINSVDPAVKTEIGLSRILYSTDCLAYQDEKGVYHRGVIDLKKFNNETLKECYFKDTEKTQVRLVLDNQKIITPGYYYNDYSSETRKILVYDGQNKVLKELKIYVQKNV